MKKMWLVACALWLAPVACEKIQDKAAAPANPGSSENAKGGVTGIDASSINVANAVVKSVSGETVSYAVEVAKTSDERKQGLQNREALAEDHGMWFVFENDVQEAFWMKDTKVALDIIFVGADHKIVDFVEGAKPNSTDLLFSKLPYRYTLEVSAGQIAKHHFQVGDTIEFRVGS